MTVIGVLLGTLLLIFQFALVARLVVDWAGVLVGGPEPGWRRGARHATHAVSARTPGGERPVRHRRCWSSRRSWGSPPTAR